MTLAQTKATLAKAKETLSEVNHFEKNASSNAVEQQAARKRKFCRDSICYGKKSF